MGSAAAGFVYHAEYHGAQAARFCTRCSVLVALTHTACKGLSAIIETPCLPPATVPRTRSLPPIRSLYVRVGGNHAGVCACTTPKRPAALRLSSRHKGGAKGLAQRSKTCTQLLCLDVNETSRSCPQDSSRQPSNGRVTDREPGDTPSRGRELTKGSNTRQRCVAGPSDNRTQGGENQLPCQHARTFYSLQQRRTQKNTPHTRTQQHKVSYRSNETRLRVLQTQHGRHSGAHRERVNAVTRNTRRDGGRHRWS